MRRFTPISVKYSRLTTCIVKLEKGGTITFKRVAPKNFAYKNQMAMMVTSVLRAMGQSEVTDEHIRIVQEHLRTD